MQLLAFKWLLQLKIYKACMFPFSCQESKNQVKFHHVDCIGMMQLLICIFQKRKIHCHEK